MYYLIFSDSIPNGAVMERQVYLNFCRTLSSAEFGTHSATEVDKDIVDDIQQILKGN